MCRPVSRMRAEIWTPPARLAVGAMTKVSRVGREPGLFGHPCCHRFGRQRASLQHQHAVLGLLFVAQLLEQLLLDPGMRPERPRAHREELVHRDGPAGVLRGHARDGGMVGPHRHSGPRLARRSATARTRCCRVRPCRSPRAQARRRSRRARPLRRRSPWRRCRACGPAREAAPHAPPCCPRSPRPAHSCSTRSFRCPCENFSLAQIGEVAAVAAVGAREVAFARPADRSASAAGRA